MWKELALLLAGLLGLLFSELGGFVVAVRKCAQVKPPQSSSRENPPLLFLAVSDMHVLGSKRSSLDVQWTTWQLRKSLYLFSKIIQPDVVLGLGDHLDQGGYATDEEWVWYVQRYRWATGDLQRNVLIVDSVIGNHDAQFANMGMTLSMLQRFETEFGNSNGVLRIGSIEVIWINSLALDAAEGSKARQDIEEHLAKLSNRTGDDHDVTFRILLSHVPLHRPNDLGCGKTRLREGAHVTYVAPAEPLVVGSDVLSEASSQRLLSTIRPNLVLAGHLHTQCYRQVSWAQEQANDTRYLEMTVPTLSYRMRPDPGFTVFMVDGQTLSGKTCKLPHEQSLIFADLFSVALSFVGIGSIIFRVRQDSKNKAE